MENINEKIKELEFDLFIKKLRISSSLLTPQEISEILNQRIIIKKEIRLLKIAEDRRNKLLKINKL